MQKQVTLTSLEDLNNQVFKDIEDRNYEQLTTNFKLLRENKRIYINDQEMFQKVLNQYFTFADMNATVKQQKGMSKELKKLLQQISNNQQLKDLNSIYIQKQRTDGINIERVFSFFGIRFVDTTDESDQEDMTKILNEQETLNYFGSDYIDNYYKLRNVIERSESSFARTHLALTYLESRINQHSAVNINEILIYTIRELYAIDQKLMNRSVSGKHQNEFAERLQTSILELAEYCDTELIGFVIYSMIVNTADRLYQRQLEDFSSKLEVNFQQNTDEPIHYGYDQDNTLIGLVKKINQEQQFMNLSKMRVDEICKYFYDKIQTKDDINKLQLGIAVVRNNSVEAGRELLKSIDQDSEQTIKLRNTAFLECALQQIKNGQKLQSAVAFLKFVNYDSLLISNEVNPKYFQHIQNIPFICGLIYSSYCLLKSAQIEKQEKQGDSELIAQFKQKILTSKGCVQVKILQHIQQLDMKQATELVQQQTNFQPLVELVESVVKEWGKIKCGVDYVQNW